MLQNIFIGFNQSGKYLSSLSRQTACAHSQRGIEYLNHELRLHADGTKIHALNLFHKEKLQYAMQDVIGNICSE